MADAKSWAHPVGSVPPLDETVDLGYHLCYGLPRDEDLVMPKDTEILVGIANGIADRLGRHLDFVHMQVPTYRTDRDYFLRLEGLCLPAETVLVLGLIHYDDAAGDRARVDAARDFVNAFGVASECGWGRTDPARVPSLLESHCRAVEYINAG